jgi:hypothetical protein
VANEYIRILALTLLHFLAVIGWGGLVSRLGRNFDTFWQNFAVRVVCGLCSMYALFILLSLIDRLHRLEAIVVMGLGTVLAIIELPDLARSAAAALAGVRDWSTGDRVLLVLLGLCGVLQVLAGLTPLMFYDLQVYHLLAPAQFLMSGNLSHVLWNAQSNTPLAMQLIVGMSVAADPTGQAAKLLFSLIGCLAAIGAYEFIRPAGLRPALLAALCVLSFPEFLLTQTFGAIDLAIAGLMIFGAIWARQALQKHSWRLAIPAGLALGLAVGSRYQAILLVCWMVAVFIGEAALTQRTLLRPAMAVELLVMAGLVTLLVAPWLLRNYAHLGNPVFPLLQSVWGGSAEWSARQNEIWSAGIFGPSLSELPLVQKVLAPIGPLLIQPSNGLFGTTLLLGAMIAIFLGNSHVRMAGLLGLSGLVIWGLLRPSAAAGPLRYNALSLVLLLAATGAILGLDWIKPSAGMAIALVLCGGSLVAGVAHVQGILPAAQSLVSPVVRQAIYQANNPSWEAFDYINGNLDAKQHKVLLIGETRAFWLRVPYVAPSAFNGEQLDAILGGNSRPDAWRRTFSGMGLTHLLISNSEIERWHKQWGYLNLTPAQADEFNRWLHELNKVFDDGRGNVVLALGGAG